MPLPPVHANCDVFLRRMNRRGGLSSKDWCGFGSRSRPHQLSTAGGLVSKSRLKPRIKKDG